MLGGNEYASVFSDSLHGPESFVFSGCMILVAEEGPQIPFLRWSWVSIVAKSSYSPGPPGAGETVHRDMTPVSAVIASRKAVRRTGRRTGRRRVDVMLRIHFRGSCFSFFQFFLLFFRRVVGQLLLNSF